MNILFYQNLHSGGTALVHVYEVARNLSRLGHSITFLDDTNPVWECELDFSKTSTKPKQRFGLLFKLPGGLGAFWRGLRFLMQNRGKTDVIYMRHGRRDIGYLLAKLFRIPLVKEVNGIAIDERKISQRMNRITIYIVDRIERFMLPRADRFIVVTERLKQTLQTDYGVPEGKIVVIPNGANTELFKPMPPDRAKAELNLNSSYDYVCFVGSLWPVQGVDNLIRSAPLVLEELPDTKFLIVGDGQLKAELINLAENIGILDKFIFTGMVPYKQAPLYISASAVCVVPATNDERNQRSGRASLKLFEYLACGKPVVVGDVEGDRDVTLEAKAGYVVRAEDSAQLSGAIIKLLKDKELGNKLGGNGRRVTLERYSWESVAERVAQVCQAAIGKG